MEREKENMSSKGPKNKKQIGRIGKNDKIYIEDYAVTYLNQIARAEETKAGFAGLFGTCREVEGIKEYYIYAAIYQECENIFQNGLPREAVQKIMRQRGEMFVEYFFLGWALILNDNNGAMWENCYRTRMETLMGKPEVLMTLKRGTCEEHFYLYPTEMPKETEGYFIFYEKNDAMQSFLIDWHGTNHKDKCDEEGDNVAVSCRNYYKEKKAERLRTRLAGVLLGAAALLLLFSAGMGVQSLNQYEKMKEVGQALDDSPETESILVLEDLSENELSFTTEETLSENYEIENVVTQEVILPDVSASEVPDKAENEAEEPDSEESGEPVSESTEEEVSAPVDLEEDETIPSEEIAIETDAVTEETAYVTYEVAPGDTLYGICVRFYGNLGNAKEICELNNIKNMDNILYGQKIILPQ